MCVTAVQVVAGSNYKGAKWPNPDIQTSRRNHSTVTCKLIATDIPLEEWTLLADNYSSADSSHYKLEKKAFVTSNTS